jgi:hypothetical protein
MTLLCLFAATPSAPTRNHVVSVIRHRPDQQVGGVDAWGVIAFMPDDQPFGDGAVMNLPRETMCRHWPLVDVELAVSKWVFRASPHPAVARRVNVSPKPHFGRRGWIRRVVALLGTVQAATVGNLPLRCLKGFSAMGADSRDAGYKLTGHLLGLLPRSEGDTLRAVPAAPGHLNYTPWAVLK